MLSLEDRLLPSRVVTVLVLIYFAAFGVVSWNFAFTNCPNCQRPFGFGLRYRRSRGATWPPRCVHCGVQLGQALPPQTVR